MMIPGIRSSFFLWLISFGRLIAQNPESDFSFQSNPVCINESVSIINSAANTVRYEWDFCLSDLTEGEIVSTDFTVPGLSDGDGYWLGQDNATWHGFVVSSGNHSIIRLDFGDAPTSTPTVTNLGDIGGALNGKSPRGLDLIKVGGVWYGITGFQTLGSTFTLLDFGSSLTNTPTATDIGNFGLFGRIYDLRLAQQADDLYLVFPYYNASTLYRVNFGSSFYNYGSVTSEDIIFEPIPDAALPRGLDLINIEGNWKAVIVSESNSNIHQIDLGSDLSVAMSYESTYNFESISMPNKLELIREGFRFYGVVTSTGSDVAILDFKDFDTSNPPTEVTRTFDFPRLKAITAIKHQGSVLLQGTLSLGTTLNTLHFDYSCDASVDFSRAETPSVKFSDAGFYRIELRAFNSGDSVSIVEDTLEVLNQIVPDITFSTENQCILEENIFSPSITGLVSYSWDFDDDNIEDSNLESPTYQFNSTGNFIVRLDVVSSGDCRNNFYEQVITIHDSPPSPDYSYSAAGLCTNMDIDFINLTDDDTYTGSLTYFWEFIDDATSVVEGTSTTKDPTFAFLTSGNKTVRLTSSIPGCDEQIEQTINISSGATSNFSASSGCQNEAIQFTNTSVNAVSYFWNFGDGFTSTNENPTHIFSSAGNFNVVLTSTDLKGCDNTVMIEVTVSGTPQVGFDFDVPCTLGSTSFTDLTTVDDADLAEWSWLVDGEEVSTQQNPILTFTEVGVTTVSLVVSSTNGCESTYHEDIEVLGSPSPDFSVSVACQGEVSSFVDRTVSTDNAIVSWLWNVDGVDYGTQDISHLFNLPGFYDITLEVTGQNFCSESITKTIEVLQLPNVDFLIQGNCDNGLIKAEDQSMAFSDPIVSRRWLLDGTNVGNGIRLYLENLVNNSYELELEAETSSGCFISTSKTLTINTAPEASFTYDRFFGIPNDQINFTNNSTESSSYQWLLDGELFSTSATTQSFLFPDAGEYEISLIARNDSGCTDTVTQRVLIAVPEIDLLIGDFDLVREGEVDRIFLEIENQSNLPIEAIEVRIELENQFSVTEQILQFLDVGSVALVRLNTGIPLIFSRPAYFCVNLISQYETYPDINPTNNEKCITLESAVVVENPFPNPVANQFSMKIVMPEIGQGVVRLMNSSGKIKSENIFEMIPGLNNVFIEMSTLTSGIYFVIIEVLNQNYQRKVIKL